MQNVLLSLLIGFLAPFVFFMGAEPFGVHGRISIMGIVAGFLAVALCLAFYQFWFAPKRSRGFWAKWPTLVAMTAPLFVMVALKLAKLAFHEGPGGPVFTREIDRLLVPLLIAGCFGSCAGAVLAGRVTLPAVSLKFCRRSLMTSAALLAAVALVIAAGVIPPFKAGIFPHATPRSAVPVFWWIAALNLLAATLLVVIAIRATNRDSIPFLGLLASLAFLLMCLLTGPAFTYLKLYLEHGPAIQTAWILLYLCVVAEFLAGVLASATAFLLPELSEQRTDTVT